MIQVAIDGPAGGGKSSTARAVARELGFLYVDSGAMYRAVTLYLLRKQIDPSDIQRVKAALKEVKIGFCGDEVTLNGQSAENEIRSMNVSNKVSEVAAIEAVREFLVSQQRELAKDRHIIMDGRDIGTVVFPNAQVKIYMVASTRVRAERRQAELAAKGQHIDLQELIANIEARDHMDSTRAISPLRKAQDAIELDTTNLPFEDQVRFVVSVIKEKIKDYDCNHR